MKETDTFIYTDERFADLQMLRYKLPQFEKLSLQQKKYIYYLSQATLCGRDITTDQFGKYNIYVNLGNVEGILPVKFQSPRKQ